MQVKKKSLVVRVRIDKDAAIPKMSTSSTCVDRLGCYLANNFRTMQLYIKNHHRVNVLSLS